MYTNSSVWCVYDHTKPYQLHWARGTTEPLDPTVGSRFQLSYLYLSYGWIHCLGKKEVLADGIAGLGRLISEQILSLSSLWLNKANTHLGVRTLFVRVALLLAVVALLKFSGIVASHPLPSLKTSLVCISSLWVKKQVMWPSPCTRGVSRARPTSAKEGKGLVNCVYKPCPTALYSAVQSRCSILSHDTLHHCLSSNSSLENGERRLGHLLHYCRRCKNNFTTLLREHAYSTTGNSRVHYLKSGYIIQLIAFRWDKARIYSSPEPFLSCGSGAGLRD